MKLSWIVPAVLTSIGMILVRATHPLYIALLKYHVDESRRRREMVAGTPAREAQVTA